MNVFLNFALTGMKVPHYFARWSADETTPRKRCARAGGTEGRGGRGKGSGKRRETVHESVEGKAGDELVRRAEMIASMPPPSLTLFLRGLPNLYDAIETSYSAHGARRCRIC